MPDGEQLSWQLEAKVPLALQDGYSFFLIPDGRRCAFINIDGGGQETFVLMVKTQK